MGDTLSPVPFLLPAPSLKCREKMEWHPAATSTNRRGGGGGKEDGVSSFSANQTTRLSPSSKAVMHRHRWRTTTAIGGDEELREEQQITSHQVQNDNNSDRGDCLTISVPTVHTNTSNNSLQQQQRRNNLHHLQQQLKAPHPHRPRQTTVNNKLQSVPSLSSSLTSSSSLSFYLSSSPSSPSTSAATTLLSSLSFNSSMPQFFPSSFTLLPLSQLWRTDAEKLSAECSSLKRCSNKRRPPLLGSSAFTSLRQLLLIITFALVLLSSSSSISAVSAFSSSSSSSSSLAAAAAAAAATFRCPADHLIHRLTAANGSPAKKVGSASAAAAATEGNQTSSSAAECDCTVITEGGWEVNCYATSTTNSSSSGEDGGDIVSGPPSSPSSTLLGAKDELMLTHDYTNIDYNVLTTAFSVRYHYGRQLKITCDHGAPVFKPALFQGLLLTLNAQFYLVACCRYFLGNREGKGERERKSKLAQGAFLLPFLSLFLLHSAKKEREKGDC